MNEEVLELYELFKSNTSKIHNEKLKKIVQDYSFLYFSIKNDLVQNQKISTYIKESNVITISHFKRTKSNEQFYIYCFKNTIMISQYLKILFQLILLINPDIELCFLFDTKNTF